MSQNLGNGYFIRKENFRHNGHIILACLRLFHYTDYDILPMNHLSHGLSKRRDSTFYIIKVHDFSLSVFRNGYNDNDIY